MRILFFGVPSTGHLVPMLPLAKAALAAGHQAALIASDEMAPLVSPLLVLPAGPTHAALVEESTRRSGGVGPEHPGPAAIEFFVGTRIDLAFDAALEQARGFGPDLIVVDAIDFLGPMVAAALGVPWATHALSQVLPGPLLAAFNDAAAAQYTQRGITPTARVAYIDPLPDLMHAPGTELPADRLSIRPGAYDQPDSTWAAPTFPGRDDRPRVLVTLGTTVNDPAMLNELISSVATADVNVIVTLGAGSDVGAVDVDRTRVHPVSFVPLARLLPGVDLVVSAAGTGTVLATLAAGLPMVLMPIHADQPWNAERAVQEGLAVAISNPERAACAVQTVLDTPSYAVAAKAAADAIAHLPAPDQALKELIARIS
jgi:UDP:flavonoid glycosyltransferase YjiC (YdhE family)